MSNWTLTVEQQAKVFRYIVDNHQNHPEWYVSSSGALWTDKCGEDVAEKLGLKGQERILDCIRIAIIFAKSEHKRKYGI